MDEVYTTGTWTPAAGKEQAFVEAWSQFAAWASERAGAGRLRLAKDAHNGRYVSFGNWAGIDAVRAWKSAPEFRDRLARVLQHVDAFEPAELAVVAAFEDGHTS